MAALTKGVIVYVKIGKIRINAWELKRLMDWNLMTSFFKNAKKLVGFVEQVMIKQSFNLRDENQRIK